MVSSFIVLMLCQWLLLNFLHGCVTDLSDDSSNANHVILKDLGKTLRWRHNERQITSLTIVYSIVYSDADQRKHQSSAPLAFVRGIHRGPVNSPHKWPVTRKMFPFDDVIMIDLYQTTRKRNTTRNKPSLFPIMAWCRPGDKPWYETMREPCVYLIECQNLRVIINA